MHITAEKEELTEKIPSILGWAAVAAAEAVAVPGTLMTPFSHVRLFHTSRSIAVVMADGVATLDMEVVGVEAVGEVRPPVERIYFCKDQIQANLVGARLGKQVWGRAMRLRF